MNVRRFEHAGKNRFWEIYWDSDAVETIAGTIGTKGRASRPRGPGTVQRLIESEVAKRLKEGFVEVHPETPHAAPQAEAAPEWIARIAEAYDDDAPRLVYADWLQGQGDPLGEFIMLQCERARLDRWDPKQKPMREREEHMIALYRPRWLPNLQAANVDFTRGFVERIRIGYPFDDAMFARLLDAAPLARTLEIAPETMYSDMPHATIDKLDLARFTGLYLRGIRTSEAHIQRVVELDHIDRVGFTGASLGGGNLVPLSKRSFRALDLHTNALGVRGTQYALTSALTLEELDLGNAGIGDPGTAAIAEATLPRLERLWLRKNNLTQRSIARLAKSTGLAKLRVLELAENVIGVGGIEALCTATWPALRELDLSACSLTDDMVIDLANSPLIQQLAWLDLGHNVIGFAAARALAEVELPAMRFLDLSGTALGDAADEVKRRHPQARVVARAR